MNTKAITIAALISFGTFASASSVYSPDKGVICDKKSGFCADKYGISLGLTQEYLGAKHAATWEKRLNNPSFDSSAFTMSNGLSCDTKEKMCKKSKWDEKADPHWTMVLFGKKIGGGHQHKKGGSADMIQMEKDCKEYLSSKFLSLPRAAFSVHPGHKKNGHYTIPVDINWDEPRVEEKGACTVVNGVVKGYKAYR